MILITKYVCDFLVAMHLDNSEGKQHDETCLSKTDHYHLKSSEVSNPHWASAT